jgi:hypothetical protein
MKRYRLLNYVLPLGCACLVWIGTASSSGPISAFADTKTGARVIVSRVANFGSDLSLILSVDGREVARLVDGRSYDSYLSPGQHVLSAKAYPNPGRSPLWQQTLNLTNGQTYSFTALWQGSDLVLVKNR